MARSSIHSSYLDTSIFLGMHVAKFLLKDGHDNRMCYNEIGLCAQNIGIDQ